MEESSAFRQRAAVVERLYHEAAALRPHERDAFLAEACGGDEALRRELELLLEQSDSRSGLLDTATGRIAERLMGVCSSNAMRLTVGNQLGSYTITAVLGKGGMGEVYRARDKKLNREVAIKFLSSERSSAEARKRFVREARVSSSLNHPHILTVFDVDEFEGSQYIVTELVDGGTLRDWLSEKPRSWQQIVELLTGLADGLAAAHDAGILHRDIKPANILVSRSGYAKLADFGLATLQDGRHPLEPSSRVATDTTLAGAIVGTVRYMSPEQASGLSLDSRSDVFSFGIVLFEALTGRRPFDSDSDLQVLQAIIHDSPQQLGSDLPAGLRALAEKALEKDPARRFQTMREMVADLKALLRNPVETPGPGKTTADLKGSAPTSRRHKGMAIAAVLASVVVIGAGMWFGRRSSKPTATPNAPVAEAVNGAKPAFDIDKIQISKEDRLIVADFVNKTGDPVFDGTLTQALSVNLEQSNVVRPMSPGQVARQLEQMRLKPDTRVTPELAKDICIRTGEKATLTGSIAALEKNYQLLLTVIDCTTDDVLAVSQARAEGKEKVWDALSQAVDGMREGLGEKLARAQKPGGHETVPITTASPEAFQMYAMGLKLYNLEQYAGVGNRKGEANTYFRQAREIDPKFAWAWMSEYLTAEAAGRATEKKDLLKNAYGNRIYAGKVERLMVEAYYAQLAQHDLEKKRDLLEQVLQLAPHTAVAQNELGNLYSNLGNRKRSTELHEQLLEDHPEFVVSYTNLQSDYFAQSRYEDARRVLARALTQKLEIPNLHIRLLGIAFQEGNQATIEKEMRLAEQENEAYVRGRKRDYAYAIGRFKEADALGNAGVGDASKGHIARAFAEDCGALPVTKPIFALLWCGERQRAAERAGEILANPKRDRAQDPIWRAIASMGGGEPQKAVKELASLVRGDFIGYQYLTTLSKAYLDLNQPAEAANALRKAMKGQVLFQDSYPRMRVELARALEKAGDKAGAKKEYEAFLFRFWEDADQDIPLVMNAKREYDDLRKTN